MLTWDFKGESWDSPRFATIRLPEGIRYSALTEFPTMFGVFQKSLATALRAGDTVCAKGSDGTWEARPVVRYADHERVLFSPSTLKQIGLAGPGELDETAVHRVQWTVTHDRFGYAVFDKRSGAMVDGPFNGRSVANSAMPKPVKAKVA